jgi:hypothetical protein
LASERGVQIELSGNVIAGMFAMEGPPFGRRVTQLPTTERFDAFVGAVRTALGLRLLLELLQWEISEWLKPAFLLVNASRGFFYFRLCL